MTMTKLSISLTEELDKALNVLTEESHMKKSRLIEQLIRETPEVYRAIQRLRLANVTSCDGCNISFKKGSRKFNTKSGVLCINCYSQELGNTIEKHPLVDPTE